MNVSIVRTLLILNIIYNLQYFKVIDFIDIECTWHLLTLFV